MILRRSLLLMALAIAPTCWADTAFITAPKGSFAAAVLGKFEQTDGYEGLKALYDAQLAADGAAGRPSLRAKKLFARLQRLRGIAASASNIDPERTDGIRVINFVFTRGRIERPGIVAHYADEPGERQDDAAAVIARFIDRYAQEEGLVPFDLPPEVQPQVDAALARGFEAARKKDFVGAVAEFGKARTLAPKSPEVFYNLGLAESKIPGRELRAVCWLGAYLDFDPNVDNAPAVRSLIDAIKSVGVKRFLRATQDIVMTIPDTSERNIGLQAVVDLWATLGDYPAAYAANALSSDSYQANRGITAVADDQVRRGNIEDALRTASTIKDAAARGGVLLDVAEMKQKRGDMDGALKVVDGIESPYYKATAYAHLADFMSRTRNFAAAADLARKGIAVVDAIKNGTLREKAMATLAGSLARAGDFSGARAAITKIHYSFQIGFATLALGEFQAMYGETAGSQATLGEMQAFVSAHPEAHLESIYSATKAKIAEGHAGDQEQNTPDKPSHSLAYWVNLLETDLSGPEYIDLKAFFSSLPMDHPSKVFETMKYAGTKMVATYGKIAELLK